MRALKREERLRYADRSPTKVVFENYFLNPIRFWGILCPIKTGILLLPSFSEVLIN